MSQKPHIPRFKSPHEALAWIKANPSKARRPEVMRALALRTRANLDQTREALLADPEAAWRWGLGALYVMDDMLRTKAGEGEEREMFRFVLRCVLFVLEMIAVDDLEKRGLIQ